MTQKPGAREMSRAFARVLKAAKATKLPGIEQATSYGTPSLKLGGKMLMRIKDAETFVFRCTMEEKTLLMEAEPKVYFETDHYLGYPLVLVRAGAADDAELAHCVTRAWRAQAPKKLKAGLRPAFEQKPDRKESRTKKSTRAKLNG